MRFFRSICLRIPSNNLVFNLYLCCQSTSQNLFRDDYFTRLFIHNLWFMNYDELNLNPGPLVLAWQSAVQCNFDALPKTKYFGKDEVFSLDYPEIGPDRIWKDSHPRHFCLAKVRFEYISLSYCNLPVPFAQCRRRIEFHFSKVKR